MCIRGLLISRVGRTSSAIAASFLAAIGACCGRLQNSCTCSWSLEGRPDEPGLCTDYGGTISLEEQPSKPEFEEGSGRDQNV